MAKKNVAAATSRQSAAPPVDYASAMDKIRDDMAKSKDAQIALLGEGLTTMLLLHPEWEAQLAQRGKDIKGALGAVRKNAVGGCSDPVRTTKSLIEYYGINCADPRRLALEVTAGMMGGETPGGTPAAAGTSSDPASGATFPKGEGKGTGDAIQKPSPVGEGGTASAVTDEVLFAPAPDPFDLDALLGVI